MIQSSAVVPPLQYLPLPDLCLFVRFTREIYSHVPSFQKGQFVESYQMLPLPFNIFDGNTPNFAAGRERHRGSR